MTSRSAVACLRTHLHCNERQSRLMDVLSIQRPWLSILIRMPASVSVSVTDWLAN